ncbi:hypothetical protein SAMN05444392_10438 [Seinonella peptonophila]|uniref:Uncharacterized protein n=1 Tax=Seinonella peptonophila TaxID=112248 RepID=A0A1M4WZ82_9BACL|nr:hypothetical protein [Seinonella peptonophila]SHE86373.1 hypothetical protein SAMN05444392_10438 [Seinonella peptonophila]
MNRSTEQYDLIIIGSGETGHSVIKTLQEQGKKALLIELEPGTSITTVQTKQQPSSPVGQLSKQHNIERTAEDTDQILVCQQKLVTQFNETTTYSFLPQLTQPVTPEETSSIINHQTKRIEESDIVDAEFIDIFPKTERQNLDIAMDEHEADEILEVVEPELIGEEKESLTDHEDLFDGEFSSPFKTPFPAPKTHFSNVESHTFEEQNVKSEPPMHEQLLRRKFQADDPEDSIEPSFPLSFDGLQMDDHRPTTNWAQNVTPLLSNKELHQQPEEEDSFLDTLLDKPLPVERESRLRKRFMNKQRIEQQLDYHEPKSAEPVPIPSQKPEIKPPTFKTQIKPQMIQQKSEPISEQKEEANPLEVSKPVNIEPIVARRRTRTQKKKIMLTKNEALFETKSKKRRPHPSRKASQIEETDESLYNFENPSIQPFMRPPSTNEDPITAFKNDEQPVLEKDLFDTDEFIETAQPTLPTSNNDSLKRDDIEFEEPYDGYNSWDEFVTPYSTNNRKRQELDQIEKRKIALRGLHNLINNLG